MRERHRRDREVEAEAIETHNEVPPSILSIDVALLREKSERERAREAQVEERRRAQQERLNLLKKKPSQIVAFKSFPGIPYPNPLPNPEP